ncbi:hypothetical protein SMACR_09250 [Sordaria macrospora]|uniref:WGS project CABT00000000 data, contig 2.79 n=2 Tax=Sordaria macrospora TaxID=5147 RepID=F7WBM4_SORMK|nr:uncharacterized protein SMAC_09250 [Sordaria macrospora k-hell]KAA8630234.1 hypothetical protein SMACR_09250 [Sordaria macrospora]KAH7634018.1 hypothetical protein B0T09DRAFT_101638 [Sordaria sp. MPI-SDFR-AT-0083]WPJ59631.1 hypothetical protein SMAC4_09250 [Sordaria macrospora]CCC14453.1 unnamed protein product [Sordaria macrospora k-hell]
MAHMQYNQQAMPSGLSSRRGGQNIKPLSFDFKSIPENDTGIPTPRTSRSHLLAGLRTAPKSATATSFSIGNGPASPTVNPHARNNRNSITPGMYDAGASYLNGPKTSMPTYGGMHQAQQQAIQQQALYNAEVAAYQQQQQQQQQYTTDQGMVSQLSMEDSVQGELDPNVHAQLMYTNHVLAQRQQQLQQQLQALQTAAQQLQSQGYRMQGQAPAAQQNHQSAVYQQQMQQHVQQQVEQLQQQRLQQQYLALQQARAQQAAQIQHLQQLQALMTPTATQQQSAYSLYDPTTGQQALYEATNQLANQTAQLNLNSYGGVQQPAVGTPRLQVSPPPTEANKSNSRNPSPPRRFESPVVETAVNPLPPPSANAFRRGHKKSISTANGNKNQLTISTTEELPKTAGPKTSSFPMTPMTAGYGPGQARAGEHPVRQPRNPPSLDELKSKPTSKHEGSKNFVARTRRSAIHNLVRAGLERRKEARSSGSISPISESADELVETPLTDNDSDSGRSGSGILLDHDDAECSLPSSRTSTGSWGAIGSDRPSSRQKTDRKSVDSTNCSDNETANRDSGSFASLLKNSNRGAKAESAEGQQRKARLVLSTQKRSIGA